MSEEFCEAYPEVLPGVSEEYGGDEPLAGNVTVTREGLRKLLAITHDAFGVAMASMILSKDRTVKHPYQDRMTPKALADLCNRSSKVWCEGKLIASGLFIDSEGYPIINECAEGDR